MKPSTSIVSDRYQEEAIEIEFRELTLNQLLKVIHQIEYSKEALGIQWIRMKSVSPTQGLLHATLKVFTLKER